MNNEMCKIKYPHNEDCERCYPKEYSWAKILLISGLVVAGLMGAMYLTFYIALWASN